MTCKTCKYAMFAESRCYCAAPDFTRLVHLEVPDGCDDYETDLTRDQLSYSFPDGDSEAIKFSCRCGNEIRRVIDLTCGGEINCKADRDLVAAALEFVYRCENGCGDLDDSWAPLLEAAQNHPGWTQKVEIGRAMKGEK